MSVERSESVTAPTRIISLPGDRPLHSLSMHQVYTIDEALMAVGPFGEVRLIKNRGKLRFIQTVRSEDLAPEE